MTAVAATVGAPNAGGGGCDGGSWSAPAAGGAGWTRAECIWGLVERVRVGVEECGLEIIDQANNQSIDGAFFLCFPQSW